MQSCRKSGKVSGSYHVQLTPQQTRIVLRVRLPFFLCLQIVHSLPPALARVMDGSALGGLVRATLRSDLERFKQVSHRLTTTLETPTFEVVMLLLSMSKISPCGQKVYVSWSSGWLSIWLHIFEHCG